MVIKHSSSREVAGLLQDLQTGDEIARETAAARLAVIGARAVEGLIQVASAPGRTEVRGASLAALESIGDPRAIDPAFAILDEGEPALALQASAVLRLALESPRGTEVLDRLAAMALDTNRADKPRLAAFEALQGLAAKTIAPIREKLRDDPSEAVRAAVAGAGPMPEIDPASALEAAAGGNLPDNAESIRRWLAGESGHVPLAVLHRLLEGIRAREAATGEASVRAAWMTARAAVHLALAERGSRVALYDLRETIEGGAMAPVEMLAALEKIGDASCLEPIAAAFARLAGQDAAWWRQHLASAFRAIAFREKVTERQALVRRIRSRWPEAAIDLLGPPKR